VLLERYSARSSPTHRPKSVRADRALELPDPLLADYLFGHTPATSLNVARLVAAIRDSRVGEYRAGPEL